MSHKRVALVALTFLITGVGSLLHGSSKHSQKTYLETRSQSENTAMEYSLWHKHAYKRHSPAKRSHLHIVPFYQDSQEGDDLGKYFGIGNGTNKFTIDVSTNNPEINKSFIIHDQANNANAGLKGTIAFSPEQEIWGARLDCFHDLGHTFRHFFFKANTTVVRVAHNMKMNVSSSAKADLVANPTLVAPTGNTQFSLQDYFAGKVLVNAAGSVNLQNPLTSAKIDGRRTAAGFADIDLGIGYKVYQSLDHHLYLSIDTVIPTGNRATGEYLFEPIYGNGHHYALGASADGGFTLWNGDWAKVRFLGAARYKYLFENTQHRTLGLTGLKMGHYFLLAQIGDQHKPLTPAANVLTQAVTVTPGSQVDGLIMLTGHCRGFTLDFGYNMYWRDAESVHLKQAFANDKYYVAEGNSSTAGTFALGDAAFVINQTANNPNSPLLPVAQQTTTSLENLQTPSHFTHKIAGGIGYCCEMYEKYHCSLGIGGSYEFAHSNADIENYAIWLKTAVSF